MSRRPVTIAALALSATALSACGTGLQAQTYRESGRQDGGSTNLAGIAVRNLHVTPPLSGSTIGAGGTAVIAGILVNQGKRDDTLLNASTDVASVAALAESGQPVGSVPVPAGATSTTTWSIVLSGLTKSLEAGRFINVTLVFEKAGRTTVQVPIRAGDNGLSSRQPEQNPYGEG